MNVDLKGRVAVVLGGTAGIGRAIARAYAECGAQVVVQGRNAEAMHELTAEIVAVGAQEPLFVPADLYAYNQVDQVVQAAVDHFGGLDIMVANGGTARPKAKLFHEMTPTDIVGYFESRAYHRLNAIHAAYLRMRDKGYGKIIVVTTDAGRTPTPAESMIGAAAGSLVFATRALAREFTRSGVRINTICTTLTSGTPPYEHYSRERDSGDQAVIVKTFAKLEAKAPFGINSPEDLAALALYLAAAESDQVTGATISVNGGLSFPG